MTKYDDDADMLAEERDLAEVRCKLCGVRGLIWEEARGEHNRKKYVLTDEDGNIHDCRNPVVAPLSDFPITS